MNVRKGVFTPVSFVLLGLGVINPMRPAAIAASAEGKVPAPSQVFTPRTALAIYADLQGASQSAIWKAIADNSGPLAQQLQSLEGAHKSSLQTAQLVPGLKGTNVAEIAVALEGENLFNNLQAEQFDPNSGFLVAARLAQTPDVESLIQQTLAAIEKEKPGLRGEIEKSRRRVGAAEFFDLPVEALGGQKFPFTVSFAAGPGKDGLVVGLGRSENLQGFLSGRTEGKLRG